MKETSKERRLKRIRNKLVEVIIKAKKGENSKYEGTKALESRAGEPKKGQEKMCRAE